MEWGIHLHGAKEGMLSQLLSQATCHHAQICTRYAQLGQLGSDECKIEIKGPVMAVARNE